MTSSIGTPENIDAFFQSIDPNAAAYSDITFNYLAFRSGESFEIFLGRVLFNTGPTPVPSAYFESENVRAATYSMQDLGRTPRELINQIISGVIPTPNGPIQFLPNETSSVGANYDALHPDGLRDQQRYRVLTILAGRVELESRLAAIDWELKASPEPYDGLQELATSLRLGPLRGIKTIEVVAFCLAVIDATSTVSGTTATLRVKIANNIPVEEMTLGYRLLSKGNVTQRAVISGAQMTWETVDGIRNGLTTFTVPEAAVLHCIASYRKVAQSFFWVADPTTAQNPRRVIYEVADNRLEILQDLLFNLQGRSRNARELETAVSWLLWMNGFYVLHLGGTSRAQDGPDIIATTPRGNIAVIECTTGLLRTDNKLPRLIERTNNIRRRLDESGNRHLRILSVILTSRTRSDVAAEIEQAEKLKALVVTRENLEQAVQRTLLLLDPEVIFEQGERAVQEAVAKYDANPTLL